MVLYQNQLTWIFTIKISASLFKKMYALFDIQSQLKKWKIIWPQRSVKMMSNLICNCLSVYYLDYKEQKQDGNLEVEDGEYAISYLSNIRGIFFWKFATWFQHLFQANCHLSQDNSVMAKPSLVSILTWRIWVMIQISELNFSLWTRQKTLI